MRTVEPTAQDLAFRKALEPTLAQEGKDLDAAVILALTAHFVGQLIALQDQRKYTPAQVMQIVSANIEQGNQEAVESLRNTGGGMH